MSSPPRPRRALLSVYDKTGLAGLAAGLVGLGWDLLASRGTAAALAAEGVDVTDVADRTGFPPLLGHRVVTLHPRVHAGILADIEDPDHVAELDANRIEPIDLVVVNLYPFTARPEVENIDIGGVALLRAAAKNHARIGVLADPSDYPAVLAELADEGRLSADTRLRLARRAFAHTLAHDEAVIAWLDSPESESGHRPQRTETDRLPHPRTGRATHPEADRLPRTEADRLPRPEADRAPDAECRARDRFEADRHRDDDRDRDLPETVELVLHRVEGLRYGENPHQRAARYRIGDRPGFFDRVTRRGGASLSYLNLADAAAAWNLVCELTDSCGGRPAAVIVKHANPCGAAVADDPAEAYRLALECDPQSAFGGIAAVSADIDSGTADAMVGAAQADVIIAPGYAAGVCERLHARRAATRLIEVSADSALDPRGDEPRWELRQLGDEFLLQDAHRSGCTDERSWRVVTSRRPTRAEWDDAVFAWRVCAAVTSNAVVLARGGVAWGIGVGQQNRAEAGRLAAARAAGRAEGGACASDGFYPFADGVEAAAAAGAAVVVQPGGSVNDSQVIASADALGLSMLFTGQRQFRH